jgi:hypothetical protein
MISNFLCDEKLLERVRFELCVKYGICGADTSTDNLVQNPKRVNLIETRSLDTN